MAGELFGAYAQVGKETTHGTLVAATRRMYFTDPVPPSPGREVRQHRFSTGTRQAVRATTVGPQNPAFTLEQQLSPSEILELLLCTVKGGVTPTTPGGGVNSRDWTFTPGATLDSQSWEIHDGARGWKLAGVYGNSLKIAGNANGPNTVTAELFGLDLTQAAPTGALAERVPDFFEGWESAIYVDAFGGTPGTTVKADLLVNWDVTISNNLARKFLANNVNRADALVAGEVGVEAVLTFEAASADALTEYTNAQAATERLVRLEFGNNEVIEAALKKFVRIDIPGAWEFTDLGGSDAGTRVYQATLKALYDATNAFMLQVVARNIRTAAY